MASLKCSKCGFGMHYHDEPNGIEYIIIAQDNWSALKDYSFDNNGLNYMPNVDEIELLLPTFIIKVWKCPVCGTIAMFDNSNIQVNAVYVQAINGFEVHLCGNVYYAFSDYSWDKLTELPIKINEVAGKCEPDYVLYEQDKHVDVYLKSNLEYKVSYEFDKGLTEKTKSFSDESEL